jgi:hypothetical protein
MIRRPARGGKRSNFTNRPFETPAALGRLLDFPRELTGDYTMNMRWLTASLIAGLMAYAATASAQANSPALGGDAGPAGNGGTHFHFHFYGNQQPNAPYSQASQYPIQDPRYPPTPAPNMSGSGGGYGGWGWGSGGGTAAGSYLQGQASAVQAAGQYNLYTAEAMRQAQAAREAYQQNEMQRINDYYAAKQINANYNAATAPPPLSRAEIDRINAERLPKRLRPDQFNQSTGEIHWPDVLKRSDFDADRAKLNQLFAARTHDDSGVGSENYHAIQMAISALMARLHDDVKALSPAGYLAAVVFIDSLSFESRFAPMPKTEVAARSQ